MSINRECYKFCVNSLMCSIMLFRELIMTEKFDFNEAPKAIQSGQAISGKDGVLAPSQ